MFSINTVRTAIGVIGNIISFLLFASPVPTFWRIYKKKDTEEFQPYPYLAAMMNCMMWVLYGLPFIHPDSTLIVTINAIGLAMEILYLIIFFIYANPHHKYRLTILGVVLAEVVFLAAVALFALLHLHTTKDRTMVVGIICVVFGMIMYVSPLSNLIEVYRKKDSQYMPFALCGAGFVNGGVWFTYAFLKHFDLNLALANGAGVVFGAIQVIVFLIYWPGWKRGGGDADVKPRNVQLSARRSLVV